MDLAWPLQFANYLHQEDIKGLTANKAHVLVVVCSITRYAKLVLCGGTDTVSVTLTLNSIMLRTPAIVRIITDRQSSFTKMAKEARCIQMHKNLCKNLCNINWTFYQEFRWKLKTFRIGG